MVQFAQVPEAETAIAKFQQYMYGGRPLGTLRLAFKACFVSDVFLFMNVCRCALQRSLAHVHAVGGEGGTGRADAGGRHVGLILSVLCVGLEARDHIRAASTRGRMLCAFKIRILVFSILRSYFVYSHYYVLFSALT